MERILQAPFPARRHCEVRSASRIRGCSRLRRSAPPAAAATASPHRPGRPRRTGKSPWRPRRGGRARCRRRGPRRPRHMGRHQRQGRPAPPPRARASAAAGWGPSAPRSAVRPPGACSGAMARPPQRGCRPCRRRRRRGPAPVCMLLPRLVPRVPGGVDMGGAPPSDTTSWKGSAP